MKNRYSTSEIRDFLDQLDTRDITTYLTERNEYSQKHAHINMVYSQKHAHINMASLNLSEAAKMGKIQTILIPHGMTMVSIGK